MLYFHLAGRSSGYSSTQLFCHSPTGHVQLPVGKHRSGGGGGGGGGGSHLDSQKLRPLFPTNILYDSGCVGPQPMCPLTTPLNLCTQQRSHTQYPPFISTLQFPRQQYCGRPRSGSGRQAGIIQA